MNNYILILLSIVVLGIVIYLFFLNKQIMQLTIDVKSNMYDVEALREIVANKYQNNPQYTTNHNINDKIKHFSQKGFIKDDDDETEIISEVDEDNDKTKVEILEDDEDYEEDEEDEEYEEDDEEDNEEDDEEDNEEDDEEEDEEDDEDTFLEKNVFLTPEDDGVFPRDEEELERMEKELEIIGNLNNDENNLNDIDEIKNEIRELKIGENIVRKEVEEDVNEEQFEEIITKNIKVKSKSTLNKTKGSPSEPAKMYETGDVILSDNDNKLYKVMEDKNGVKKWKLVQ